MKRNFYTDPLAAAWMAKYFGMRIICGLPHHPMEYASSDDLLLRFVEVDTGDYGLRQATRFDWYADGFYIHPDSLHLLDPLPGDLVRHPFGVCVLPDHQDQGEGRLRLDGSGACNVSDMTIIQRNGISFHWPESADA